MTRKRTITFFLGLLGSCTSSPNEIWICNNSNSYKCDIPVLLPNQIYSIDLSTNPALTTMNISENYGCDTVCLSYPPNASQDLPGYCLCNAGCGGENRCRNKYGYCGSGADYSNSESLYVPSCSISYLGPNEFQLSTIFGNLTEFSIIQLQQCCNSNVTLCGKIIGPSGFPIGDLFVLCLMGVSFLYLLPDLLVLLWLTPFVPIRKLNKITIQKILGQSLTSDDRPFFRPAIFILIVNAFLVGFDVFSLNSQIFFLALFEFLLFYGILVFFMIFVIPKRLFKSPDYLRRTCIIWSKDLQRLPKYSSEYCQTCKRSPLHPGNVQKIFAWSPSPVTFISHKWNGNEPELEGDLCLELTRQGFDGKPVWIDYCCVNQETEGKEKFWDVVNGMALIPFHKFYRSELRKDAYDKSIWCQFETVLSGHSSRNMKLLHISDVRDLEILTKTLETFAEKQPWNYGLRMHTLSNLYKKIEAIQKASTVPALQVFTFNSETSN